MTTRVCGAGPGHRQTRQPANSAIATRPVARSRGMECRLVVCGLGERRETNADGGRASRLSSKAYASSFRKQSIAGTDCGDRPAVIAALAEPDYPGCVGEARACGYPNNLERLVNTESSSSPEPPGRVGPAAILLVTGSEVVELVRAGGLSGRVVGCYGGRDGATGKSTPPLGDGHPGRRFRSNDRSKTRCRLPGHCLRPYRRKAGPDAPRTDQARLRGNNSGDAG
jgi:hypothetical protein